MFNLFIFREFGLSISIFIVFVLGFVFYKFHTPSTSTSIPSSKELLEVEKLVGCDKGDLSWTNSNAAYYGCTELIFKAVEKERKDKMTALKNMEPDSNADILTGAPQWAFHQVFDSWVNEKEYTRYRKIWCDAENSAWQGSASNSYINICMVRYDLRAIDVMNRIYEHAFLPDDINTGIGMVDTYDKNTPRKNLNWEKITSPVSELIRKLSGKDF